MSTTTESPSSARATVAPGLLALAAIASSFVMPFIGLPVAMVAVVVVAASGIPNRRLRLVTMTLIAAAIFINLAFVMMSLPAGRELVQGESLGLGGSD